MLSIFRFSSSVTFAEKIPEFLICYFTLFTIYVWAAVRTHRCSAKSPLHIILGFAFLFRVILFFSQPCLSDDIHRYLWEGYLQSQGVNPFKFAPQAPELVPLRNDVWLRVNNKDASAIYPPLLQMVHAAAFMAFRSVWGFKLLFLIAEAALIWVLLRLLRLYGRSGGDIIFYTWNPLVVVEIAGSGHHDACVVALLFAAALFTLTARHGKSSSMPGGLDSLQALPPCQSALLSQAGSLEAFGVASLYSHRWLSALCFCRQPFVLGVALLPRKMAL